MVEILLKRYELIGGFAIFILLGLIILLNNGGNSDIVALSGSGVLVVGGTALYYTRKMKQHLQKNILRRTSKNE